MKDEVQQAVGTARMLTDPEREVKNPISLLGHWPSALSVKGSRRAPDYDHHSRMG